MEEARQVLARLERIERLRRADAAREEVLGELRCLVKEGERWAALEPGADRASELLGTMRARLDGAVSSAPPQRTEVAESTRT